MRKLSIFEGDPITAGSYGVKCTEQQLNVVEKNAESFIHPVSKDTLDYCTVGYAFLFNIFQKLKLTIVGIDHPAKDNDEMQPLHMRDDYMAKQILKQEGNSINIVGGLHLNLFRNCKSEANANNKIIKLYLRYSVPEEKTEQLIEEKNAERAKKPEKVFTKSDYEKTIIELNKEIYDGKIIPILLDSIKVELITLATDETGHFSEELPMQNAEFIVNECLPSCHKQTTITQFFKVLADERNNKHNFVDTQIKFEML